MKRVLTLFMACVMMVATLSGCGSTPSSEKVQTDNETADETQEEKAEETNVQEGNEGVAAKDHVDENTEASSDTYTLRIGSLKGPTSMGLVSLMDKTSKGEAKGNYEFTMVTDASELVAKMVSGDLDIVLVPANMASILYQKTNQGANVVDINTLGVLYVVAADDSITSVADLKGKTIYLTGKGTTPDYVFQYLLTANGLSESDVTIEYKSEAAEVAAVLKENPDAIGLLPQPFVTAAMAQNESLKMVLDLTAEWDKVQTEEGGSLLTGVTVCRSDLLTDDVSAAAITLFMEEHKESAEFANSNVEEAAQLVSEAGIIENAQVAAKALPYCSITYIDGTKMKEKLSGYLGVLFEQDPASVGGQLPEDPFYYIP